MTAHACARCSWGALTRSGPPRSPSPSNANANGNPTDLYHRQDREQPSSGQWPSCVGSWYAPPSRYYFRLWELTFSPEYDLDTDTVRAMDVVTNTFCAGGGVTADGVWVNLGGKLPSASAIVQSLNRESHRQPRSYMGWQHRY